MVNELYHRADPHSSSRPISRFVAKIERFVCDHPTPQAIEKLRSKGVAMHTYGIPHTTPEQEINYMALGWAVKMNVKIEQG